MNQMLRFKKNKLSFTICGSWEYNDTLYFYGIRGDGVFLDCVNSTNLEKVK